MKKVLFNILLTMTALCILLVGGITLSGVPEVQATEEAHVTYGLYMDAALATLRGGKTFTRQYSDNAILRCRDGNGDGKTYGDPDRKVTSATTKAYYFSTNKDTKYDFDAGVITDTSGARNYHNFGDSEVFYQGYPGGVTRGEEWVLDDDIDTTYYSSISFKINYVSSNALTGDAEGESFIYLYGEDENGDEIRVNKKVPFGVNYWSTGVIEFPSEMKTVSRVAVSILWNTVSNQSVSGSPSYVYISSFRVNSRNAVAQKVSLRADDMALDFCNGVVGTSQLSGTQKGVFYRNGGYAAFGGFKSGINAGADEYIYGTQRMSAGAFLTLRFKDPVKASDYKYFDLEMLAFPQNAEGSYEKETATEFTYYFLKYNASSDSEYKASYTLKAGNWQICRLTLSDFADEAGYVNSIIILYYTNNSGRESSEEAKYTIQTGIHDAELRNDDTAYTSGPFVSQRAAIKTAGLTLGESLTLRYQVDIDDENGGLSGFDGKFTFLDGTSYIVGYTVSGEGYLVFNFAGLSPKYMSDTFDFVLTADSSMTKGRVIVVEKIGYSVKEYCESLLASDAEALGLTDEKFGQLRTLVVDLLNYGAAAQNYRDYRTDALANAGIDQEYASTFAVPVDGIFSRNQSEDGNIYFSQARLVLDSKVNIGFKVEIAPAVTGTITAQYQIGSGAWNDVEISGGNIIVVKGLTALQFSEQVSVKIFADGEDTGASITYNVHKYVENKCNDTDGEDLTNIAKLVRTLYCYGVSATAYNG